jgi:dCTP deaminase
MIIPAQTLRNIRPVTPFVEKTVYKGMSYGLSHAGYDIRVAQAIRLTEGAFSIASSVEEFDMPRDVLAQVADKSSWARQGLSLFNTVIEPGWRGFLTIEMANLSNKVIEIPENMPIAQILFFRLEEATEKPYEGKYQNQKNGPQEFIHEPTR